MEEDSTYRITNPKQISNRLNQLLKNKCLISVHFGESKDSFITTLIKIDDKQNVVVFDYGPKEYLNKQLLNSSSCEFRTEFDGISVSFNGKKVSVKRSEKQNVFTMPIPTTLVWIQRRKFYRVKIPLAHTSICEIKFTEDDSRDEQTKGFNLLDISLSGFSFINDDLVVSHDLIPTAEFKDCQLQLNGAFEETVSFVIKNKFNLNPVKPEKGQRIGCAITKITPASESNIQRYMQNIERELKNVT